MTVRKCKIPLWFGRYLEGEKVEFYIEGSGGYIIANIDLISQEIYFTKQEIAATHSPTIFFSYQREYDTAWSALMPALSEVVESLNEKSRLPLSLELSQRPADAPMRLSSSQLRKIRKSLIFIADCTPVACLPGDKTDQLVLSSNVCVEIGYAYEAKDPGQILLVQMERLDLKGQLPFDSPISQQLKFKTSSELTQLQFLIETLLQRFNLFM